MGKSSKKSTAKVDAAPVTVIQSGKKGKRGAEKAIEKAVSAKKQKVERDETVVAKQKAEKKVPKKVESSSSSEEDSDSEDEPKVVVKKTPTATKNGSVAVKKPTKESSSDSSDDSESDSDGSDDEKPVVKKQPTAVKNGSAVAKKSESSDSSESESDDSDEDDKVAAQPKKAPAGSVKKTESSDSTDSDDTSSDEDVAAPVAAPKGKVESSDSSSDDSDSEEETTVAPAKTTSMARKPAVESSESDSDSEEDSDEDSSESDDESKAKKLKAAPAAKPSAKPVQADSSSDEESSDDESDEQPAKKASSAVNGSKAVKKDSSSEESDDESSDEDDSDEEEKQTLKTPKKKDTDVEMVDAEESAPHQKTPKTPATPQASGGSKTLFVGNLSFKVHEADVREFFKDAGEIVDIRFASNPEGQFKGFGHIEFATAEAAQEALKLHDQPLLDRPVRLDLARERGAYTPQSRENNSFQKGDRAQGSTAFVRGFDTSAAEDDIRGILQEQFGPCGEITRISIPPDRDTGGVKGMAYIDFADNNAFNKALELNGCDIGDGCYLTVQEAKPRGDSNSGGGGGGRFDRGGRSGRGGGGRFSDRGGRSGRGGGGRFSDRGGRGGRGRGAPRVNITAAASGKKTTFADDD